MRRNINVEMEYPETCKLSKEERDELFLILMRIIRSYICADYEVEVSLSDEYGKEKEKF